ncbi:MAG: hypothetical protein KAR80_07910, partial [Rhodospirillaceae bacterium]|nr:hypothetical protein [Rhodospirillaceae bacterium]
VVAGQLTYLDNMNGVTWRAPMADARLSRSDDGLDAELDLGVDVDGKTANLSVLGSFYSNLHRVDLGVSFSELNPSSLAGLLPQIDIVSAVDIPLSGTITFSAKTDGNIEGVGFDLSGEAGHISLPVPLASKLDLLPFAQRIKVDELKLTGSFDGKYRNIEINNLDLQLADDETIYLPSPLDMEMPFKKISIAGRYMGEDRRVEVEGAEIDLGGPIAKIRAKVNGVNWPGASLADETPDDETPGAISLGLSGVLHGMRLEGLERYWPKIVAPDARKWVLENMPKGVSPKAEMVVSLVSDKDGVHIDTLEGSIEGRDVTINYLSPMPAVTGANGVAAFDKDSFDIQVTSADSYNGVVPNNAVINFTKLNTDDPVADFDLNLSGSISGALDLINYDPLNFAEVIGLDPQKTSGTVETNLKIYFPFRKDLSVNDVSVNATSNLVDAEFSEILFGRNLTMGNLQLEVNNAELNAVGTAQLGGVPVGLAWQHDFRADAIFRDKYELTGRIDNVLGLGDMGIAVPDLIGNYISGGAEANVSYTVFGNDSRALSARIDLVNIHMAAPELGWSKEVGVPGTAVLELRLKGETPVEIPSFEISAPELDVSGSVAFREDGTLDVINIEKVISRRTSMSGSLVPHDDGTWEVSFLGDEFDASLLWDDLLGTRKDSADASLDETEFVFSGAADFRTLWLGKDRAVHDFIGTIYREGKLWKKIDMQGRVGEKESINIRLETYEEKNERRFGILSNDAGAALRVLGIYDLLIGGKLRLEATYKGTSKDAPLLGVLKVQDYALKEAPALANLIGVLSLTGV